MRMHTGVTPHAAMHHRRAAPLGWRSSAWSPSGWRTSPTGRSWVPQHRPSPASLWWAHGIVPGRGCIEAAAGGKAVNALKR